MKASDVMIVAGMAFMTASLLTMFPHYHYYNEYMSMFRLMFMFLGLLLMMRGIFDSSEEDRHA